MSSRHYEDVPIQVHGNTLSLLIIHYISPTSRDLGTIVIDAYDNSKNIMKILIPINKLRMVDSK
jgi:hypothetical protein